MQYNKWHIKRTYEGINYCIMNKLKSGQTIKLELEGEEFNKFNRFNVYLTTNHKQKNIDDTFLKRTGKDGLYPLIWAKKRLLEVESLIKEDCPNKRNVIYVMWDDGKRKRVYIRGLSNVGYKMARIEDKMCLMKTL